jgi:hypothetical protein
VRNFVRQNVRFFLSVSVAALALRLFFVLKFPHVTADSNLYADLAKNWLLHGVYGITADEHVISPSFVRLPGYPGFLALVFAIFGLDNYRAVFFLQALVDLGTCFAVADLAKRISERAAKAAFVLTAFCPFLAVYAAAALTETLEIFFTALAMNFAIIGLSNLEEEGLRPWLASGTCVAACILLRPDGGILLAAIGAYLGFLLFRVRGTGRQAILIVRAGIVLVCCALVPLVPWGLRNYHTLHRLEFLAPRYANELEEFVPMGFNRWTKTWIADYVSTEEIYWNVPGKKIDPGNLPSRAFDSERQHVDTVALLDEYNLALHVTPELDARFAALAQERIRSHRMRYYVWLPLVRIADMWLRPRTELLPPDSRWYEFDDDRRWIVLAVGLGVLNLLYILAAIAGLVRGSPIAWVGLGLSYIVLRSLFLGTLENPETRYTLECFPAVIVMASALWGGDASPSLTT